MFILIETADAELLNVSAFAESNAAIAAFDRCCLENNVNKQAPPENDCGTIATGGDDSYSVLLIETDVN